MTPTKAYEMRIEIINNVAHITRTEIDYSNDLPAKNYNLANITIDDERRFVIPNDGNDYFFVTFIETHPPVNLRQTGGGCECYCHGSEVEDHSCGVSSATNDCVGGCTSCLGNSFWDGSGGSTSIWRDGSGAIIKARSVVFE